jgi:hypothetical protein
MKFCNLCMQLDFEHYDPNSPYPPPTNNPYMRIEREVLIQKKNRAPSDNTT